MLAGNNGVLFCHQALPGIVLLLRLAAFAGQGFLERYDLLLRGIGAFNLFLDAPVCLFQPGVGGERIFLVVKSFPGIALALGLLEFQIELFDLFLERSRLGGDQIDKRTPHPVVAGC